jgi:hypothetical protein
VSEREEMEAALRAHLDQTRAAVTEFAQALGEMHKALVEQGFSRGEALTLCTTWIMATFGGASQGGAA